MEYKTNYLVKMLWVSLLVLITYSCSTTTIITNKKKHTDNFAKAEREDVKENKNFSLAEEEDKTTLSDLMTLESIWAENYEFSEKEKSTIGFCLYDFFSENESVRINLDSLSNIATFPFNGILSSNYGFRGSRMHNGIDISARNGARDIHAFLGGVVRISTYTRGFGNIIVLRHYNGLETIYAHNKRNLVERGDVVHSGDVIAIVGSTGRSTGAHLHFEVRVNGKAIDPNFFINPKKLELKGGETFIHRFGKTTILASSVQDRNNVIVKKYYAIKSGDTLSHLSKRYRIPISELCKMNNISTKSILRIGQKLRVA